MSNKAGPGQAGALALSAMYKAGQATPVEATEAALARIDRFSPVVNAYCHIDHEGAKAAARAGSLTTSDEICDYESPPADLMRRAGAVILGKTNTPEFGWKGVIDNRVFGATGNAWNTDKTSGGSSGGAASAAALFSFNT